MSVEVQILNRQRTHRVDRPRLQQIAATLLREELGLASATLGVHLVSAAAMAKLNWRWLQHEGSTDVITFDHRAASEEALHGELYISVGDAESQAREHATTPADELVRYVVHGVLHLQGYDDLEPRLRRVMKREENRLVRRLARQHPSRGLLRRGRGAKSGRGRLGAGAGSARRARLEVKRDESRAPERGLQAASSQRQSRVAGRPPKFHARAIPQRRAA